MVEIPHEQIVYPLIVFAVIILVTWIIAHVFNLLFTRWYKTEMPLVRLHVQRLATIIIWSAGLILAVEQLGLRIDFLLLLIGLIGVGAIIATKDAMQNLAAKYFSDAYIPFKMGDNVRIRDHSGKVIEINPVATVLLTDKEELVSVPNYLFLRETTINTTPQAWKQIIVPIAVSGQIDLPDFERKIMRASNKFKIHLDERFPPILTMKRREHNYIELVLTLMVKDPTKKDEITSEINRKIAGLTEQMKHKHRKSD